MAYVDGFVIAVPRRKLKEYLKLSRLSAKVWLDLGALEYCDCQGDDLAIKGMVPFTKFVGAKRGEVVMFAYVVFKSRAHRDKVNARAMKDPRLAMMMDPASMPFDCTRMAYGGFQVVIDL